MCSRPSERAKVVNAAEALAEARRAYAEQAAKQAEGAVHAAELAECLKWMEENPGAVRMALTRGGGEIRG